MRSRRSLAWLRLACCGLGALACTRSRELPEGAKSAPASASSPVSARLPVAASPALIVGNAGPGVFELRAARPVRVAMVARLEQRIADGSWIPDPTPDGAPAYLLSESCPSHTAPPCRSLTADETLVPVAWSGEDCAVQCGKPCTPDERFRSGVHRLVVTECEAPHERFEGPAFEMPPSAKALARLRAATGVDRVRAARLDNTSFKLPANADEPGRIAGYKEISDTSQQLSAESLADLRHWLRAEASFNDNVVKRCPPGVTVGFVLERTAPSMPQRTDLGVDVSCARLDIVQNGDEVSFSFFDPSREQLLGILSRVLPNDRLLKREIDRQLLAAARLNIQRTRPRVHSP